jgi:hypothetical protein
VDIHTGDKKKQMAMRAKTGRKSVPTDKTLVEDMKRKFRLGIEPSLYAVHRDMSNFVEHWSLVIEQDIRAIEARHESIESSLSAIRGGVASIETSAPRRNRFMSMFKRDKLGTATRADLEIIGPGRRAEQVHGGDAIADAGLFIGNGSRRDVSTYEHLYGMSPRVVTGLCSCTPLPSFGIKKFHRVDFFVGADHRPTIDLLNAHAHVRSSMHERGTNLFYDTFARFIMLLEEHGYDEDYLSDDDSDIACVYYDFLRCTKDQVRGIEDTEY